MATTRRQLRRWIGGNFGELIDLEATEIGSNTATFKDAVNLEIPDSELNGREAWYVSSADAGSAANVGTRRVVLGNDQSDFSITVGPDWPGTSQPGDVVELYNARGYSATISEIHEKINELINEVSEEGALATTSIPETFNAISPTVAIPSEWIWVFGAEYQDIYEGWHTIYPADLQVREWDGTVTITGRPARYAQTRYVRLIGAPALSPLTQDSHSTTVDAAWLVDQAVAELRRSIANRWGDAATSLAIGNIDLAEAEKRRPRAGGTFPNTGRRWRVG